MRKNERKPLVKNIYTADPSAHVFDGKIYIYPSHDVDLDIEEDDDGEQYKMEDYQAARVAFRNILKDDADNIYREDILYYIAMSSYKYAQLSVAAKQRERYMAFMDDYLNFVSEIPESPYRKELDAMNARAQRAIGRYAGTDEMLDKTEKDFEKERKASSAVQWKFLKPAREATPYIR